AQSQIEGGGDLRQVPASTVLEMPSRNQSYTIVVKGCARAMLCGHPEYCPEPVMVHIKGSTWGGAMLKENFIGRGMRMEFQRDAERPIVTSPVIEIEERRAA